ncbi:alpha-L-arabinofuranosidase C-terminal domain-containing protein [Streptomyces graminilatus]|uniref:alpha-L-arabinofuranosidase C-terminal domain-containing protein n=1 Tax=Streptomyces graminilatus TaxID=1464070 RepID=UPI001F51D835|nr:alpha-L-arabinofuranosidase C-terminal domain-containing protein [Streptomyces graminilatus]
MDTVAPGTGISPDLFGVFFEDISHAADGGLYAELLQNRSFEYGPADRPDWHGLTAWELLERDGAAGSVAVSVEAPLHPANPVHAVLHTTTVGMAGLGAGLRNEGFDGIPVQAGAQYDVSVHARLTDGPADRLVARIESGDGQLVHAEAVLGPLAGSWERHAGVLTCAVTDPDARFTVTATGVGNEDAITDTFRDRFARIQDALSEHHPEITVVGTVGPSPSGQEWEDGWAFARERQVPVVDEHSYKSPRWFLENTRRFDALDREDPHLCIGEYGSWGNDGRHAVAEAAYMIGMERNGDVVRLASYAPLLGKRDHIDWAPDLIYFDNTHVWPTLNYHVQRMHSVNSGDTALPVTVTGAPEAPTPVATARHRVQLGTTADTCAEFADIRLGPLGTETAPGFADWQPESGVWKPDGEALIRQTRNDASSDTRLSLADAVAGPSYVFAVRARKTAGTEGFVLGFGGTSAADRYEWSVGGWKNRSTRLQRVDEGTRHDITDPVPNPVETGRWYDLRVEVDGLRFRCFRDGELVHDFEDVRREPEVLAVSAVRDSAHGEVIIKIANATADTVTARLNLAGADGDTEFTRTTLATQPHATSRFEPAPASPVEDRVTGRIHDLPPCSFTVLRTRAKD